METDILNSIEHDNIIKLEGVFEENDKIFMILEYLDNGDFYDFIKNNCKLINLAPIKVEIIQYYIAQLVNVLEHLKGRDVIHRDLKVIFF